MTTNTPPLSPIRQYITPRETSPTSTYRDQLRRRTSSFSSNHDRSPTMSKSRHRFSNGSQFSTAFDEHAADDGTRGGEGGLGLGSGAGGGLGNLADELDQLDDEDDFYEETPDTSHVAREEGEVIDGARDSGIDVSYTKQHRNQNKPFGATEKPPDESDEQEDEDRFSVDLEEYMSSIAHLASSTSTTTVDPLIPRTLGLLQDLGNQSSLEATAQRLSTSTNSTAAHLNAQTKAIQTLFQALYPILSGLTAVPLDPALIEETIPLTESLSTHLPQPDALMLQKLQKLDRETAEVLVALSQITDTLQMGKQISGTAARHLRTTQMMVVELRQERERAELAQLELKKSPWPERLAQGRGEGRPRWCEGECGDILQGFERCCEDLRGELERGAGVTA